MKKNRKEQLIEEAFELLKKTEKDKESNNLVSAIKNARKCIKIIELPLISIEVRKYPRLFEIYFIAGILEQIKTNHTNAILDFTKGIDKNKNYIPQYAARADSYIAEKQNDLALDDLTSAIMLVEKKQKVHINQLSEMDQIILCQSLLKRGKILLDKKKYIDNCIADFNKAIEMIETNTTPPYIQKNISKDLYLSRGIAYMNKEQYPKAVADFKIVSKTDPKEYRSVYLKAKAEENIYSYKTIIKGYKKALQLKPDSIDVLYDISRFQHQNKKYKSSISYITKAINIDKQNPGFYLRRTISSFELEQYNDVIKDAKKAIKLDSKSHYAYFVIGNARGKLGKHDDAIENFNIAINLNHNFADAYHNRGMTKTKKGEAYWKDAINDFSQTLEIDPKHTVANYHRGEFLYKTGDSTELILTDFFAVIQYLKQSLTETQQIFKYTSITDYQILSLINKEVYFSKHDNLNDPLECCMLNDAEWFLHCLDSKNITPRILSLTLDAESKLMYSHYAESHTGICIGYKIDFDKLDQNISYGNVFYKNGKTQVESFQDLYLLKNKEWEYEKEFRLVRFDNKEFLDVQIESITFGYKCTEEHRKIIITLLKDQKIKYYEMIRIDKSNELKRQKLNSITKYYLKNKELLKVMLKNNFDSLYHYHKKSEL